MSLVQAVGVIMGANIGTTITAQMVSLDLDAIAPFLFVGIGAIAVMLFVKRKNLKIYFNSFRIWNIVLGMNTMSSAMAPLGESETFVDIIYFIGDNKLLGVLAGLVMTAIVQSSSATTGILVALASTGSIDMNARLPIIFGCNIGTCVYSSSCPLQEQIEQQKKGLVHLLFNTIGVLIFLPFMNIVIDLIQK